MLLLCLFGNNKSMPCKSTSELYKHTEWGTWEWIVTERHIWQRILNTMRCRNKKQVIQHSPCESITHSSWNHAENTVSLSRRADWKRPRADQQYFRTKEIWHSGEWDETAEQMKWTCHSQRNSCLRNLIPVRFILSTAQLWDKPDLKSKRNFI